MEYLLPLVPVHSPIYFAAVGDPIKIEKLEVRDGQFGPWTVARIGGIDVSAFNAFHRQLQTMKVGDDVSMSYERKGNYDRITSLSPGSNGNVAAGAPSSVASGPTPVTGKDNFPVSMKVSYAKDLLVANTVGTAKEAADLVNELIEAFKIPDPT